MFLSLQKFLLKTTYWYYTEDEKLLKITEISVRFTEDNNLDSHCFCFVFVRLVIVANCFAALLFCSYYILLLLCWHLAFCCCQLFCYLLLFVNCLAFYYCKSFCIVSLPIILIFVIIVNYYALRYRRLLFAPEMRSFYTHTNLFGNTYTNDIKNKNTIWGFKMSINNVVLH